MAMVSLTNQEAALTQAQTVKTQLRNQLLARKPFLDKMTPEQLRAYYKSGKDPVLVEIFQIYKGLDAFFDSIREEE